MKIPEKISRFHSGRQSSETAGPGQSVAGAATFSSFPDDMLILRDKTRGPHAGERPFQEPVTSGVKRMTDFSIIFCG